MKNSPRQPDVERDFIAALKELRIEHRMTQEDLAAKLTAAGRPLAKSSITWLETGRNRVTLADSVLIAGLFGTNPLEMITRGRKRREYLARLAGRHI
jgi:transcriptional regulator with XRE-family HTH domain